jgi:hypothetical protein
MEQFKYSLGPYELFSSIIGGVPILLASLILYNPIESLRDVVPIIKNNSSISIAVTFVLLSYILGGLTGRISWFYFLFLCKMLKKDYHYFGDLILRKKEKLENICGEIDINSLPFEERLTLFLIRKIGIPEKFDRIDERLMIYLRGRNAQSVSIADSYRATHIMYRGLSLGFLIMTAVLVINVLRVPLVTSNQCYFLFYSSF